MIHTLFPSYIYQAPVGAPKQLHSQLLKESQKIAEIDEDGKTWSIKNYPGGFTSYGSLCQLYSFSPYFDELRKLINSHVHRFAKQLEMDISPKELKMKTLWVNIMPPGVTHTMHIHPLSVISGTYYVQVPKGTSQLKVEDPRHGLFMASPPRKTNAKKQNQQFVHIEPKKGDVILFESWMRHEVPPNPSPTPRISISFNYDWC